MKKAILFAAILLLLVGTIFAIADSNHAKIETRNVKIELDKNKSAQDKLESDYKTLEGANTGNEQKVQELERKRQQLEKEKSDLEAQLQAKAELKASQSKVYAAVAPTVPYTERGLSGNAAKDFIYSHESGNNPGAINKGSGACGLGQALPCSKMPCSLTDYNCQDTFFTGYMQSRYGTWEKAMAFWQANRWW